MVVVGSHPEQDIGIAEKRGALAEGKGRHLTFAMASRFRSFIRNNGIPYCIHTVPFRRLAALVPLPSRPFNEFPFQLAGAYSVFVTEIFLGGEWHLFPS